MRFVPDGPDIPREALLEWRKSELMFLAGAGVSAPSPACLPNFRNLALQVYQRLGEPLFKVLTDPVPAGKTRDSVVQDSGLPARQKVEADLLLRGEIDRLFSAMEARLNQDASGRSISRTVRDAVEAILRDHKGCCQGHRDLLRLSTVISPSGIISQCRIATTNFDRLFEDAWVPELGGSPISFDARIAPRPGAHNFEGVMHLHGMLLYTCRASGERHAPLWETLHEWAEWSRRDMDWVKEKLLLATSLPPTATDEFSRSFVQHLLQLLDPFEQVEVVAFLRDNHVAFDWIETIAAAIDFTVRTDDEEGTR